MSDPKNELKLQVWGAAVWMKSFLEEAMKPQATAMRSVIRAAGHLGLTAEFAEYEDLLMAAELVKEISLNPITTEAYSAAGAAAVAGIYSRCQSSLSMWLAEVVSRNAAVVLENLAKVLRARLKEAMPPIRRASAPSLKSCILNSLDELILAAGGSVRFCAAAVVTEHYFRQIGTKSDPKTRLKDSYSALNVWWQGGVPGGLLPRHLPTKKALTNATIEKYYHGKTVPAGAKDQIREEFSLLGLSKLRQAKKGGD